MTEPITAPETGAELEVAVPQSVVAMGSAGEILSDDEIRRLFRIADGLARSSAFKDARQAEQAFAKMVVGRDLGLTPAQSMQGVQFVEGGIQMHYAMLGQFVRARPGYDYRAGWLKRDDPDLSHGDDGWPGPIELVWMNEEEADDLRPIFGVAIEFTVNGEKVGVSRFTEDDARQANLIKTDARAAWNTSRRNMLLARSMSNGIKWFVPEVFAGMPVYAEGEIPRRQSAGELTRGTGSGDAPGIDLGPKVEEVIARATELGHVGYSDRAAIELALGSRSPQVVNDWVAQAHSALNGLEPPQEKVEPDDEAPEEVVNGEVEA